MPAPGHGPGTQPAIAVVGATGMLGGAVARLLLAGGHRAVGVGRVRARAAALASLGVEVRVADLTDPASLAAACRGVDVVVSAAHAMLGRGRYTSERADDAGHRPLIDAAKVAGAQHFVYTSVLGASPDHPVDFWRTTFHVEQHLKGSGLPWTILRPVALRGRTVEIGGPEDLTQNEVAALYGRICGRPPKVRPIPAGVLRVLAIDQTFEPAALPRDHPLPLTALEELAAEHAAALTKT